MAVIASPDVPARDKVLVGLSCLSTTGLVVLGTRSPEIALGGIVACNLSIALLTKEAARARASPSGPKRPRKAKPRPRRGDKGKLRDSS